MAIVIRAATVEDAAELVKVHYETWLKTYPQIIDGVTIGMVRQRFEVEDGGIKGREDRWREAITNEKSIKKVYVAELKDNIIGFALSVIRENNGYIAAFYVLPEVQGKGVGGRLMEASLKWLEADRKPVALDVVETNKPAISFYSRHGFTFSRKLPVEARGSIIMPSIELIRPPAAI